MAATPQEMTAQIVALTDTNNKLAQRLDLAEGAITRMVAAAQAGVQSTGGSAGKDGIF